MVAARKNGRTKRGKAHPAAQRMAITSLRPASRLVNSSTAMKINSPLKRLL
jgi:hypothetical protein